MVPESLVVEIARDDTLFLLVEDQQSRAEAAEKLAEWGADLDNVQFIEASQGGAHPWTRDWGPAARFKEEEGYSLVDPWFDDYPMSGGGLRESPLLSATAAVQGLHERRSGDRSHRRHARIHQRPRAGCTDRRQCVGRRPGHGFLYLHHAERESGAGCERGGVLRCRAAGDGNPQVRGDPELRAVRDPAHRLLPEAAGRGEDPGGAATGRSSPLRTQ